MCFAFFIREMTSRLWNIAFGYSLAAALMLICVSVAAAGSEGTTKSQSGRKTSDPVCDATADYFLGVEDYREAVVTHQRVLAAHPGEALAHYHLGFAYGMTGDSRREVAEYRQAAALGLQDWDLYLNLGRALLEGNDLKGAASALNRAIALAPERAEAHFNLGLVYERSAMLNAARDELQLSLRLDPRQPAARNMLGLIYAEEHDYSHARQVWGGLARTSPDFEPARINLAILDRLAPAPGGAPIDRNTLRTAFASTAH